MKLKLLFVVSLCIFISANGSFAQKKSKVKPNAEIQKMLKESFKQYKQNRKKSKK